MRRFSLSVVTIVAVCIFACTLRASATTQIYFNTPNQVYDIGDTLLYDLYADIDSVDSIMGFGFDLSFDGGATYVSAPGASGSYLIFDSFTGNSGLFEYVSDFDDGDTISGWRTFFDPDLSGTGIRLGTFQFTAHALGLETITLGADDLGPLGTEGLVEGFSANDPLDPSDDYAFMPNTPTATASPVPEPGTVFLLGFGLIGLVGIKKRVWKG